jgi:hypothetical protein
MVQTRGAQHRLFLLVLWGLGIIFLFSLASNMAKTRPEPPGAMLESKTLSKGQHRAMQAVSGSALFLPSFLPSEYELEFAAINQALIQKGLVMQHYQQSPYALLLTIHQNSNRANREKTLAQARSLIPTNHLLQEVLSSLKSL